MDDRMFDDLVDETIDAYVTWREERAAVWDAYARWDDVFDRATFIAYRRALDEEERAANVYAVLLARVSGVRDHFADLSRANG